jgi:hypothetical protein
MRGATVRNLCCGDPAAPCVRIRLRAKENVVVGLMVNFKAHWQYVCLLLHSCRCAVCRTPLCAMYLSRYPRFSIASASGCHRMSLSGPRTTRPHVRRAQIRGLLERLTGGGASPPPLVGLEPGLSARTTGGGASPPPPPPPPPPGFTARETGGGAPPPPPPPPPPRGLGLATSTVP